MLKNSTPIIENNYRAFELHPTREFAAVDQKELADHYPLAEYKVGSLRMVTLKRFVHVAGKFYFIFFLSGDFRSLTHLQ